MEKVERKKRREHPFLRKTVPPLLLILAAAVVWIGWNLRRDAQTVSFTEKELTAGTIVQHTSDEVRTIRVELPGGNGWEAEQTAGGVLTEREGFVISQSLSKNFLAQAAVIGYEDIFTDTASDYEDRLDEFGLSVPGSIVTVGYSDGTSVTIRIGNRSVETEAAYYYMTVDGREPLYALSVSSAEDWKLSRNSLYSIEQPVIQTARMDHIILEGGGSKAEWVLNGQIADDNASDEWVLVSPLRYPADGTEMTAFLKNIGNLHLGSYASPADAEHLEAYGFLEPRMTITLHMAQGRAAVTAQDGTISTQELSEETVVLVVGGQKSEMVSYVRYRDAIYLVSALTLGPVMDKKPMDTVTRYPVLVAAEFLSRLTVEDCLAGTETVYQLEHEQAEESDEETIRCYENGEEIPFDTFSARYLHMVVCSVSGELPEGYEAETLKKQYTFETVSGKTHTIRLYAFDSLHDAVQIDDYPVLFYLIEGGLGM